MDQFDIELAEAVNQNSDHWQDVRVGRFTSSQIYRLMFHGYREMTREEKKERPKTGKGSKVTRVIDTSQLGTEAESYIMEKVSEVLTGLPQQQSYAYPLVYGKDMEPNAVAYFEHVTGLETKSVGFVQFSDHAGGSPDRLIGEDQGLEVKCPHNPTNQLNYLMLTDRFDLKRLYPEYYWQVVSLLLFTNRKKWHFVTYDPRFILDKHKMVHITIESKDVQDDFDLIIKKLELAVENKLKLIKILS